MPRYNYKEKEAYKQYAAFPERPDGLPPYEIGKDGLPVIVPGELFCRLVVGKELCGVKTKHHHTSNLRRHIIGAHKIDLPRLSAGGIGVEEGQGVNQFYRQLIRRMEGLEDKEEEDKLGDPILYIPVRTRGSRRGNTPARSSSKTVVNPGTVDNPGPSSSTWSKNGKMNTAAMHKELGFGGRPCNGCMGLGRKTEDCPPKEDDGVCNVWQTFKAPLSPMVARDDEDKGNDNEEEEDDDELFVDC
ncbi:hypothetical protein GGR54DRAFT_600910 [Hypoxylon sp. NC1633]|nr:hypothetical protein GGR54DRAFT_600910 [Hypoxylon sp. NC1633]